MSRYFLTLFVTFLLPFTAHAQCANPPAEMGVIIMNKAHKVMQYCNGDDWIGLWGGGGGGKSLPTCTDGEIAQFSAGEWRCNNGSGLDNLNAANLKSGTVPSARLGAGTANASSYLRGDGQWVPIPTADISNLNANNLTSGTIPNARFPAALPTISGANLTNLNAANITTGTVARARLGSGTASNTTFLRGDGQWAVEADPKVGATTNTKWCRGSGSQVVCDQDAPSGGGTCASGVSLGGACWYLGMPGESCTTVCASFGGYNAATNTYAGHAGNWNNCLNVARALGIPTVYPYGNISHAAYPLGCSMGFSNGETAIYRYQGGATTAAFSVSSLIRFCGCNS